MKTIHRITKTQEELESEFKWSYLHKAPKEIINIIESDKLEKLQNFGELTTGTETGAAPYFFVEDKNKLDEKFLEPAIRSIKECSENKITFDKYNAKSHLLVFTDYINNNDITSYSELIDCLKRDKYNKTVKYLKYGVNNEYHNRPSTGQSRDIWCCIENIERPDIIHPKFFNERIFININKDNIPISNTIQGISFDENYKTFALPIISSYLYKSILEFWGSVEGAGAVTINLTSLREIPFPDLDLLFKEQEERLEESYNNILNDNYQGIADEVMLELTNSDLTVEELAEIQRELVEKRVN